MVVECPRCERAVRGKKIGGGEFTDAADDPLPFLEYTLLRCLHCAGPILVESAFQGEDDRGAAHWSEPRRVWPQPDRDFSHLPATMRRSLEQAFRCYKAKLWEPCAVMAGRAVETLCVKLGASKKKKFAERLRELKAKGIIDARIYKWGDALRGLRNVGAHDTGRTITKTDALDMLDFAQAIGEYAFVLNRRFQAFEKRQARRAKGKRARAKS